MDSGLLVACGFLGILFIALVAEEVVKRIRRRRMENE